MTCSRHKHTGHWTKSTKSVQHRRATQAGVVALAAALLRAQGVVHANRCPLQSQYCAQAVQEPDQLTLLRLLATQTALLTLKPLPKPSCHTRSPALTPL